MVYLNTEHLTTLGTNWGEIIEVIRLAVSIIENNDYAQPLKPYLRYGDLRNRIIAMPAYVGGDVAVAGIKWIASFPENIRRGMPRAHSVTILNDSRSGKPICTVNSPLVSVVRTAGVSGLIVEKYLSFQHPGKRFKLGIVGFGPIGKMHLRMIDAIAGDRLSEISIYDLAQPSVEEVPAHLRHKVRVCDTWRDAYADADLFVTATVSKERYIDARPKPGSLHLNVSLRDYLPALRAYMTTIIVDDWNEVCRENTDIELMHKTMQLNQADTCSMAEFLGLDLADATGQVFMFNPMGMAVFDIAMAKYYYEKANTLHVGVSLQD